MTLRLLACVECDGCHNYFEQMASIRGPRGDALEERIHELVLAAEDDDWQSRKNATEHHCSRCIEDENLF